MPFAPLSRMFETLDQMKLSFEDRLSLLLAAETLDRKQRKQQRLRKAAKIKQASAYVEDIDYAASRGIDGVH